MPFVAEYDDTNDQILKAKKELTTTPKPNAVPVSRADQRLDSDWIELGKLTSDIYLCSISVAVNDAVYISGNMTVDKADANGSGTYPAIGFVKSKPTTTQAIVQFDGELGGFSSLVAGTQYYLANTPGGITATAPTVVGEAVQPVGQARTSGILNINIGDVKFN